MALLCAGVLAASMMLIGCTPKTESTTNEPPKTETPATNEMKLVKEGVLTIGSDCDYPPFILLEGDKPVGFEYDLMEAIAADMGLQLEYLPPQNFDTLIATVASGTKMDLAVSSLTITDERKESVDFCMTYFDSNQACVIRGDSAYTTVKDLEGKVIGAQSGTTG